MKILVFKAGFFIEVKKDKYESYDIFLERSFYMIDLIIKGYDYNKALLESKIWRNSISKKCEY
jgi:hypothetical protein